MADPAFLADEMLGRLARYLRILGYDTAYGRGHSDSELADQAQGERRVLLTRDRQLARRVEGSILVHDASIGGQLRELRAAVPGFRESPAFDRCTRCNGRLASVGRREIREWPSYLPVHIREGTAPVFRCPECGQFYWAGSHGRRIQQRLSTELGLYSR